MQIIKHFGNKLSLFFSDKTPRNRQITLLEGDQIISDSSKCAEIMNNFFSDAVDVLDIDRNVHADNVTNIINPVHRTIVMFQNQPTILKIKELGLSNNSFSFISVSELHVSTVINKIDSSKSYQKDNIPRKLLKDSRDISSIVLSSDINKCINKGKFPDNLKKLISPLLLRRVATC